MNHLFCFVSSKCTENYSKLALDSFFKHTKLESEDIFLFVNNDKTNAFKEEYPINIYINNETPLNWSANFNQGLKIAKEKKMHFVVITNDIVFTKGWFEPLKQRDDLILIPSSTINFMYRSKDFSTKVNMYYDEYIGKEQYLEAIIDVHQQNHPFNKIQEKIFMQFYLARIPYQIHSDVGFFDEKFHLGGEDMDYRIRAAVKGHKTMLAMHSFILHFHGKSTWDGQETSEQEEVRRNNYINYSIEKWGEDITEIFIKSDVAKEYAHKIGLGKEFDNHEQYNIIRILKKC
jgi:GT2 family glycosyltransferase